MAGFIVFNPDDESVGLSTGDDVALNVYLDIEADVLYYTDGSSIYEFDGGATLKTYVWRSGKIRLPNKVNLGAAMVEADTFVDITFRLYADGVLKHTQVVADGEPFRLPGGYLSNIYEVEVEGVDEVAGISVAEHILELAAG
jgi:hypothetical protein